MAPARSIRRSSRREVRAKSRKASTATTRREEGRRRSVQSTPISGTRDHPIAHVLHASVGEPPAGQRCRIQIQQRTVLAMPTKRPRCLNDGIIRSSRDGDVGRYWDRLPAVSRWPFRYMDSLGVRIVVQRLEALNARSPEVRAGGAITSNGTPERNPSTRTSACDNGVPQSPHARSSSRMDHRRGCSTPVPRTSPEPGDVSTKTSRADQLQETSRYGTCAASRFPPRPERSAPSAAIGRQRWAEIRT